MKKAIIGTIIVAIIIVGALFLTKDTTTETATNNPQSDSSNTDQESSSDQDSMQKTETYTADQVAEHRTEQDCWTIINGSVYNITSYISNHPGGDEILRACGVDGTSLFENRTTDNGEEVGSGTPHSNSAASALTQMKVGQLAN